MNGLRTRILILSACLMSVTMLVPKGVVAGTASCFDGDPSKRGLMRGDVDGNGTRDEVWITGRREDFDGDRRCVYYVKADMGAHEDRLRLHGDRFTFRNFSRVMAMVRIDDVPGREFGVVVSQGASTAFAVLFTIRNHVINKLNAEGPGAPPDDAWGYGGSVAFVSAVDCAAHRGTGRIIASTANYDSDDNRYNVRRRWFEAMDTALVRTARETDRARVRPENLDQFPEFRHSPLGRCVGRVRG